MSDFFEQAKEMKKKEVEKRINLEGLPQDEIIKELEQAQTLRDTKHNKEKLEEEIFRRAIENIKISEWNRTQITKNDFKDKDQVIDILLYTVGKMAIDPLFYKMNVKKLEGHKPIYEKEAE